MKKQIQKILDLIKPIWIKSGDFEDEELETLKSLGFENIKDFFYDGKIIHFTYKEVNCSFLKDDASYSFVFKDGFYVDIYENYQYSNKDEVLNNCSYEERFTNTSNTHIDPFTITTCYDVDCKIVVGVIQKV